MLIRPVQESDLSALDAFLYLFEPNDHEGFAKKWLGDWSSEGDHGVVAIDNTGRLVGACWFRPVAGPDKIPEVIIFVQPERQREGIGRSLLAANVKQATDLGLSALQATVKPSNDGSRRLLADYRTYLMVDRSPKALEYVIALDERVQFLDR